MIIPYFGKLPVWFNLYLYSCSKVNIDFYFFTDCKLPVKIYNNTYFNRISYHDYCKIISERLKIRFSPNDKYDLVKIKPFIGIIHKDICSKYLFWGFSDIDMIYGNINDYLLNERNLNKYNLITTHSDRIAGHFTIIRFRSKYTTLCMKIPDWKRKLEVEKNIAVDEEDFTSIVNPSIKYMNAIYSKILRRDYYNDPLLPSIFQIMQKIYRVIKNYDCLFYENYTSPVPTKGQVWIYEAKDGRIVCPYNYCRKELIYLHYLFFKRNKYKKTGYEWNDDFYKISSDYVFKGNENILISCKGITRAKN